MLDLAHERPVADGKFREAHGEACVVRREECYRRFALSSPGRYLGDVIFA